MDDLEREAERAAAEVGVADRERTGREPFRNWPAKPPEPEEIAGAAEVQPFMLDRQAQRHADAEADIFLEARRARESLGGVNDLRKAVAARADARPDLAAPCGVLGHRHDHGHAGLGAGRQRPADQARELREPPPGAAMKGVLD